MSSRRSVIIDVEHEVAIEAIVVGDSIDVLMIPSAHRSAYDFAQLSSDLMSAGYGSAAVNLRRIGRSTGPTAGLTLRDVANDLASVVQATAGRPLHVVGHAQGNIFARAVAAYRPEVVRTVSLLACGGHDLTAKPPPPELVAHFERCSDQSLPDDQRLESLRYVFFAHGNDPSPWLGGWWPSGDVRNTLTSADAAEWATAGSANVLVVQPLEDPMCPPSMGRQLCEWMAPRASYVELPHSSHAMLPEQPDLIARALIDFFDAQS